MYITFYVMFQILHPLMCDSCKYSKIWTCCCCKSHSILL